jgi:hypothetical protein
VGCGLDPTLCDSPARAGELCVALCFHSRRKLVGFLRREVHVPSVTEGLGGWDWNQGAPSLVPQFQPRQSDDNLVEPMKCTSSFGGI